MTDKITDYNKFSSAEPVEQTTPDGRKVLAYSAETIISKWKIGFIPFPTFANALAINVKGLVSEEEFTKCPEAQHKELRYIYLHPDFWTIEKIRKESWRFEGVRTLLGKTYLRDDTGKITSKPYRLFGGDVDSEIAFNKCQSLLETDLLHNTSVTKTHKTTNAGKQIGYHPYWLEEYTEDSDFVPITQSDCKSDDCNFEVMVGFQYLQILGQHRNHPEFQYTNVGCIDLREERIMIRNGLYDILISDVWKELLLDYSKIQQRRKQQHKSKDPFFGHTSSIPTDHTSQQDDVIYTTLTEQQIDLVTMWAGKFYGSNGHFYYFMRSFIGTLVHDYISEDSTFQIIDNICADNGDLNQKNKWYGLAKDAYQDIINGSNVEGAPTLVKQIQRNLNYTDESLATKQVETLRSVWRGKRYTDPPKQATPTTPNNLFSELNASIEGKDFVKYAMEITKRYVRQDPALVSQVTYTGLSAYTDDPLNLAILAPTSEGKTYAALKTLAIFPNKDVLKIGTMTPKVIVRSKGILVDADNNPIQHFVDELKKNIRICRKAKNVIGEEAYKVQLRERYENARYLIDLRNLIFVFLEPPHPDTWAVMKPILSHDDYYIEHPYVYSDDEGFTVKKMVTMGWPACIFCSAKNESGWEQWPEIVSRCMVTSPNMITEKYHESNILIAQKKGLPQFMQQKLIASNKEVELAKKSILHIKMQIQEASKNKPPVWIPYGEILAEMLPDKKGTDVRATQRMLSLAGMIPLTKIQLRVGSQMHDEHLVVATLEDLEEALEITQNQSGMPLFKMKVFKEIFLECFANKEKIGKVDEDGDGKKESRIAVTIDNLTSHYRLKYGKPIASKHMREYFIPEWLANNLVDEIDSNIDKRKKIYYPLVDEKNTPDQAIMASNQVYFLQDFAIKMPKDHPGLPKNWLKYEIMTLFRISEKDTQISFADYNGNSIVENDFINSYERQGRKRLNQFVSGNQGSNGGAKNEDTPDQAYLGVSAYFPKITVKQRAKYPHICALWDLAAKYPEAEVICERSGDQILVVQPTQPFQQAHDKDPESLIQRQPAEISFSQFPQTLTNSVPELKAPGYFDCEWYREDRKENVDLKRAGQIYAFCLADATGETMSLHVNDYPNRKEFMLEILNTVEKFTTLIGFSIFGDYKFKTDLDHIKSNCKEAGIPERHSDITTRMKFIDLQRVFGHRNVRTFLEKGSKVKYDGADLKVSLDDVARSYIGEGKPEGIDGKTVEHKPPEEQLRYCLNDAILCHKLLSKNDFELIQVIERISQDIKLEFFKTINGGYTSTWAEPKLESLSCPTASPHLQKFMDDNTIVEGSKKKFIYVGGNVLKPKAGIYPDAVEIDVNSMYPTMCIEHNISPDTVMCLHPECKRDNLIPIQVMEIINNHLIEHGQKPRPWHYWICQKKTGVLTTAMKDYFDKKVEYKKSGDKLNEKETKIMMNSLYGSFGSPHFKFRDLRVAELITGFGNWTHRQLVTFGGDGVLYGDTDSLHLKKENKKIIEYAKNKLGVKLEAKRWKPLFLTNNAKTHMGINEEGEVVCVGITGRKSNYPVYFKQVSEKLISKEFLEPFVNNQNAALKKVLEYVRLAFKGLAELNPSELSCKQLWVNNLWEYKNKNAIQKQVYKEILEDCHFDENLAKQKAQGNQIWKFWKVKAKERSITIHPERYQIDMGKYRKELFKAILPQLQSFGLDIVDLKREIGVK
jgi:hypothetical protein